jgi:hypothetical protein
MSGPIALLSTLIELPENSERDPEAEKGADRFRYS